MKKFFSTLNNLLVGGMTVLFLSINGMFYSIFDKNDKISAYFILVLSMVFYLIVLIIYAIMKTSNSEKNDDQFKVLAVFKNDSGIHLILKQNPTLTLNTVCSIYYSEKNGYEIFKGIGYVYNIAKDMKIDIKINNDLDDKFFEICCKAKKNIIIKTTLNIDNIQYLGGNKYD